MKKIANKITKKLHLRKKRVRMRKSYWNIKIPIIKCRWKFYTNYIFIWGTNVWWRTDEKGGREVMIIVLIISQKITSKKLILLNETRVKQTRSPFFINSKRHRTQSIAESMPFNVNRLGEKRLLLMKLQL